MLKQLDEPMPDDLPFKETLALAENDKTVDPFDAIEMIGVPGGMAPRTIGAGPEAAFAVPRPVVTAGQRASALGPVRIKPRRGPPAGPIRTAVSSCQRRQQRRAIDADERASGPCSGAAMPAVSF